LVLLYEIYHDARSRERQINSTYVYNHLLPTVSFVLNMRNLVIRTCPNISSYYLFIFTLYA